MNIYFDTEDNSETISERKDKRVTQIFAMTDDGEEFYNRGDVLEFLQWLATFGECTVYAFNVMYDLGNLFWDSLDSLDVTLVGGRLIKARWGPVTFLDVGNIFSQTSVKKLGKKFAMTKGKLNANSKTYVKRDVEIIRKAMTYAMEFAGRKGVERMPSTLGGLAVKIWHQQGGCNWHDDSDFSRSALFGGRVELFRKGGQGDFYYTDVNSLYPFVMTQAFPSEMKPCRSLKKFGITEATVTVPKMFVCPLPVRRTDESIFFPYGTLRGVWTNHELRQAESMGCKIRKIHQSTGTDEGEFFYRDFVREQYRERQAAKSEPEKLMLKLCMNNLYGQLGLKGEIIRSLLLTEADFDFDGNYIAGGMPYGRKHLVTQKIPLQSHVNYAHAAYVTSLARIVLLEYLRQIDESKLLYCDTDSIFFEGKPPFPISDDLGKMKLVQRARSANFIAPKFYQFGGEIKAKGIPKTMAQEFFKRGQASFRKPFKFRQAIQFFDRGNIKQLSFWAEQTKFARTDYVKRRLVNGRFYSKKALADEVKFRLN